MIDLHGMYRVHVVLRHAPTSPPTDDMELMHGA